MTRKKGSIFVTIAAIILAASLLCTACGRPSASVSGEPVANSSARPSGVVSGSPVSNTPYTFPEVPWAKDELPQLISMGYPTAARQDNEATRIDVLAKFSDGRQILSAASSTLSGEGEFFCDKMDLLLMDSNYKVIKTKNIPDPDGFRSGFSFFENKGCFVEGGNTICILGEELEVVASIAVLGVDNEINNLHMNQEGEFFAQDYVTDAVYHITPDGQATKVFDNPDQLHIQFERFDAPDQFRAYSDTEIYLVDAHGNSRLVFDDLKDIKTLDPNWLVLSTARSIRYSSSGEYAYMSFWGEQVRNMQIPRVTEKDLGTWSGTRACAVLLRYKAQSDGTLAFDEELYYYTDINKMPPSTAEYREDANGNGYLDCTVNIMGGTYDHECRMITADGVSEDVALRYQEPNDDDSSSNLISARLEVKLAVLFGFLPLQENGQVTALITEDIRDSQTGMAFPRNSICTFGMQEAVDQTPVTVYMYGPDYYNTGFPHYQSDFENQFPQYKINLQRFDTAEEMRTVLSTELLAGKGPDVIWCNPMPFINPEKTLQSGYFLDLSPFIDENPAFNMEDYSKPAMDTGVFDGKRYFVPLEYNLFPMYSTQSALEKAGLKAGEAPSAEKILELAKGQATPYIFTTLSGTNITPTLPYTDFLNNMGIAMVDTEQEKGLFDQPAFQKAVGFLKTLCKEQGYATPPLTEGNEIKNGGSIVWDPFANTYTTTTLPHWEKKMQAIGEKGVLLAPPNIEESKITGSIIRSVCVNANAPEREGAIAFVQYLLSGETQCKFHGYGDIPVYKKGWESMVTYYQNPNPEDGMVSDEYITPYMALVDSLSACRIIDVELERIINDAIMRYFEDQISLEQMTKELMQRVGLYLKE